MSNKLEFFKMSDFEFQLANAETVAEIANTKLNSALELVVYFQDVFGHDNGRYSTNKNSAFATHQAHLFNIQPIVKECVKHEPIEILQNIVYATNPPQYPKPKYKCKHCGVELVATWSAK